MLHTSSRYRAQGPLAEVIVYCRAGYSVNTSLDMEHGAAAWQRTPRHAAHTSFDASHGRAEERASAWLNGFTKGTHGRRRLADSLQPCSEDPGKDALLASFPHGLKVRACFPRSPREPVWFLRNAAIDARNEQQLQWPLQ